MNSYPPRFANTNFWLIVDTVRIPNALDLVRESSVIQSSMNLFACSELEHLIEQSPLVLNLGPESHVLECLFLQDLDSSAVVYEVSKLCDELTLLQHLQSVFLANIHLTPCILRFYTGKFWQSIFQDLNSEDLKTLLGPANTAIWVSDGELRHMSQDLHDNALPEKPYVLASDIFNSWV
ncbi:DUF4123 domain-containing protein [Vibrio ponticus]|uniref:DUF4123 domain-containing protein n=1 Tax=Vibrio ponticus TaxID=265668 RepID=A0A3N3DT05_9VIBR|nr:DUF4123 domain-containing protein [Vibrio ponticus]ROV57590.1 DUF4123 domain-containing protein [Vibrio ponticus]